MSDGLLQSGQQFDRNLDFGIPFTQQMGDLALATAALASGAAVEVTPNDGGSWLIRTYDAAAIDALFGGTNLAISGFTSLRGILPDTLVSLTVGFNSSSGDGNNTQNASGASEGTYATLTLSVHSSSQGSASIMPDVTYVLKKPPIGPVPCTYYLFFIKGGITDAAILAKLTTLASATVLNIPLFSPQIENLTLRGQQVSLSASADAQQHADISASNVSLTESTGDGNSISTGITTRFVQLPETIHGTITISGPSSTATASALAACTIAGGTNWPAQSASGGAGPTTVTGAVSPTSLSATSPASIPATGLFLVATAPDPFFAFGWSRIMATVVDFSILP